MDCKAKTGVSKIGFQSLDDRGANIKYIKEVQWLEQVMSWVRLKLGLEILKHLW